MFSGTVKTEWLDDGRDMRLLETLTFTDAIGQVWEAPVGSIINGASIPKILWSVIGSPYTGKYRRPTVLHDVYCTTRTEPHQVVHRLFNEMMQCDGVEESLRIRMFKAVWYFGPKWPMLLGRPSESIQTKITHRPEDILTVLDSLPWPL